jgi:molybdopterin molybdotransferase
MISVEEAKKIIRENISPAVPVISPLSKAPYHILAADVYSPIDMPAYPQSSMDGYAFAFEDWKNNPQLLVNGVSAAGNENELPLQKGQAVRIFTGAPVPPGADTVVMQEKVKIENSYLSIEDIQLKKGDNLRPKGAEITSGVAALPKGTLITPAAIGFLAGLGITSVEVYPFPKVSIIVTGNELQQPGLPLQYGQVYESNSFTLTAALQRIGINEIKIHYAKDDLPQLSGELNRALEESDIILLTGGVSVGDYDFVLEAASLCGVTKIFHKVKQRPGKPLFFGKKNHQAVFGLPGNPASVLSCFYQYVCLAIQEMTLRPCTLQKIVAPIGTEYKKAAGLTHFLKAIYDGQTVQLLGAQESFRLSSFAYANCVIVIPEEATICKRDELVEIHLLPA